MLIVILILIFIAVLGIVCFVLNEREKETRRDSLDKIFEDRTDRVKFNPAKEKELSLLNTFQEMTPSRNIPRKNTYYKVGDGEYYIVVKCLGFNPYSYGFLNTRGLLRFQDGAPISWGENVIPLLEGKTIVKCEDPKKEHWQHFLHLEMLGKQKRQQECHKFIDRILAKQIEYNDLQLKYEMIPSAPIVDILTFKNFCDMVHEYVEFEDFEIQNYLLVKQQKH